MTIQVTTIKGDQASSLAVTALAGLLLDDDPTLKRIIVLVPRAPDVTGNVTRWADSIRKALEKQPYIKPIYLDTLRPQPLKNQYTKTTVSISIEFDWELIDDSQPDMIVIVHEDKWGQNQQSLIIEQAEELSKHLQQILIIK